MRMSDHPTLVKAEVMKIVRHCTNVPISSYTARISKNPNRKWFFFELFGGRRIESISNLVSDSYGMDKQP